MTTGVSAATKNCGQETGRDYVIMSMLRILRNMDLNHASHTQHRPASVTVIKQYAKKTGMSASRLVTRYIDGLTMDTPPPSLGITIKVLRKNCDALIDKSEATFVQHNEVHADTNVASLLHLQFFKNIAEFDSPIWNRTDHSYT